MPAKSTKSPAPKRNISNIIDMTDSDDEDIETIFISQPIKKIKREVESTGPCKESNSDSNISILKHGLVMKEKRYVSEKLEELRAHLTGQTYTYGSKYLNGKNDQLVSKLENARTTMIHSLENSIKQLDEPLKVVIIGQHKSGKTEFINYLLKDSNMKLRIDTVENREHPQAVIYGEIETTKIEKDVLYHFYNFEWLKSINFIEIPEISNVKVKDLFKKDYIISADLVIFVVSATALNSERDKEIIEHLSGCGKSFKVCITNMDKVIQDNADIRTAVKQKITKDVHFISSINSNLKNIDIYTPVEVMNSIDWAKLKLVSPLHSSSLDLDGICENLRLLNNDVNTIFTELKKIMALLSTYYQRHKLSTSKTDPFSYYRIDKEFNDMISRVNEFYSGFNYACVIFYGLKAEKTLFKKSIIEEINHLMNSINGKLENDWKQHTSSKFEIEFPNLNQNYSGTVEFFKEELNDFSFPWSSNKFSKKLTKLNEDLKQSLHQALEKRMSCFINFDTTPIFQYFQEATDMLKDQYEKLSTLNGDFKNMARSISCMPTTSN